MSLKRRLSRCRRRVCESLAIARYSRPALNGLDEKLARWLDFDGGGFIEAGANDGYSQSNTYYLEKLRGWSGLLVEPSPELAAECRRNRSQPVIEAALVEAGRDGVWVELHQAGLMSTVAGALGEEQATLDHVRMGLEVQGIAAAGVVRVPGRSLSAILDEAGPAFARGVDFLSLDVEGSEPAALAGLDFKRHAPRFICVEARDAEGVHRLLEPYYVSVEVLSDRDTLYRLR